MKRKFVICAPRAPRTTASLVTHRYDERSKRTATVYLGSFSVDLDPNDIPDDTTIAAGEARHGIRLRPTAPFALASDDVALIRDWLRAHGTHTRQVALMQLAAAQRAQRRQAERAKLVAEVEAEVRARVLAEQSAAIDDLRARTVGYDLLQAEEALERAAEALRREAADAAAAGHRLSSIRYQGTDPTRATSPLDVLQARANRIRRLAIVAFEQACKDAGLMTRKSRSKKSGASARNVNS